MKLYAFLFGEDVNEFIPCTVHLDAPKTDSDVKKNEQVIQQQIPQGPWIVKPG